MRHNTAKKIHTPKIAPVQTSPEVSAEIFDFAHLTHIQVATQAERASHLANNAEACDFEEFMHKYGMRPMGFFE